MPFACHRRRGRAPSTRAREPRPPAAAGHVPAHSSQARASVVPPAVLGRTTARVDRLAIGVGDRPARDGCRVASPRVRLVVTRQNRAEGCSGATPVRVASIGGITGQVSGRNVTLLQAVERWRASGRRTPGTPSGTPQIPIVRVAVDTRSRREAFVAMVQPADFGERYHPTRSARLNRPGRGRVLPEREVRVLERW